MTAPAHPGVLLREELAARSMSQAELARRLGYTNVYVNHVCNGRRPLSAEMAVALEAVLGTSARSWLSLQMDCDLHRARVKRCSDCGCSSEVPCPRACPTRAPELEAG